MDDPEAAIGRTKKEGSREQAQSELTTQQDLLKGLPPSSATPTARQFRLTGRRIKKALQHRDLTYYEFKIADFVLQYSYECGRFDAVIPRQTLICESLGIHKPDVSVALDRLKNSYGILISKNGFYSFLPISEWTVGVRVKETARLLETEAWLENPRSHQPELLLPEETQNDAGFTKARQQTFIENMSAEAAVRDSLTEARDSQTGVGGSSGPVRDSLTRSTPFKAFQVPSSKENKKSFVVPGGGKLNEKPSLPALVRLATLFGDDWTRVKEGGKCDGDKWRYFYEHVNRVAVEHVVGALEREIGKGANRKSGKPIASIPKYAQGLWKKMEPLYEQHRIKQKKVA